MEAVETKIANNPILNISAPDGNPPLPIFIIILYNYNHSRYRAPECLLTDGYYNEKMDIWGAGCVMFENLTSTPLFPGKNELD